jgi:hypothetical protein
MVGYIGRWWRWAAMKDQTFPVILLENGHRRSFGAPTFSSSEDLIYLISQLSSAIKYAHWKF